MIGKYIYGFFRVWGMLPWRKPLAMVSGVSVIVVVIGSWITGRDIPTNACDLGKWYVTIILGAAYGSSTIEAINSAGKALPPKDRYSMYGGGYEYGNTGTENQYGGTGESSVSGGGNSDGSEETG